MPERPPEREVKSSESKHEYDEFVKNSKRENSKPVDPKRANNQPAPSDALTQQFKSDLSAAHTSLSQTYLKDKALNVQTGMVSLEYTRSWTGDIAAYRGDMAGLWNNFKVELENSPIISWSRKTVDKEKKPTDQPFQGLLDRLALAGKRGDISQWLEQWNSAVGKQPVNWQQAAEAAASIAANIEFTKSFIRDYYRSLQEDYKLELLDSDSVEQIKAVIDDASAVLSAIAFEMNRQANAVLTGANTAGMFGSRADALRVTFREICNQMGQETWIRERIERLDIAGSLSGGGRSRELGNWLTRIAPDLRALETSAQTAADLVTAITQGKDPGADAQNATVDKLALALVAAAEQLGAALDLRAPLAPLVGFVGDLRAANPDPAKNQGFNEYLKDSGLANAYAVASALRDKQLSIARALTDPQARSKLMKGEALQKWTEVLNKIEQYRSNNFYREAERAANTGSLSEFWSGQKEALFRTLDSVAKASAGTTTADAAKSVKKQLDELFSRGLGPMLDKWQKRNPTDTYGLAWQLTATLTVYKRGVDSLVDRDSVLGAGASQVLDAITATIAAGVELSARQGAI